MNKETMCMDTSDMIEAKAIAEQRHLMIEALATKRSYIEGEKIWKKHSEISWKMNFIYDENGADYAIDATERLVEIEELLVELKKLVMGE